MLSEDLKQYHDSKEWGDIVAKQRLLSDEWNDMLLSNDSADVWGGHKFSKADLFRKEITFIEALVNAAKKVSDETIRELIIGDLNKSINWRKDILLGKMNEMGLDKEEDYFYQTDVYRKYNFWLECFENLPNKLGEIERQKEAKVEEIEVSGLDESYDALSELNAGL